MGDLGVRLRRGLRSGRCDARGWPRDLKSLAHEIRTSVTAAVALANALQEAWPHSLIADGSAPKIVASSDKSLLRSASRIFGAGRRARPGTRLRGFAPKLTNSATRPARHRFSSAAPVQFPPRRRSGGGRPGQSPARPVRQYGRGPDRRGAYLFCSSAAPAPVAERVRVLERSSCLLPAAPPA